MIELEKTNLLRITIFHNKFCETVWKDNDTCKVVYLFGLQFLIGFNTNNLLQVNKVHGAFFVTV